MLLRRAASLVAAFLLIPQLLGASDVACTGNENHAAVEIAVEQVEGHQHHQPADSEKNSVPADRHQPADCCPVMSACSGAAIGASTDPLASWHREGQAPTPVATFSLSRVESPDPPPPRIQP